MVAQRLRWRGVARRREDRAPGHAGSAALIASERDHGTSWRRAEMANKLRRRARRDRYVLWVRTGRVGTAGVDRVKALDLVAQIAYAHGGSAGRERWDVGSAREGHGGRGDEEVAKDLRGGVEVVAARRDNRGGACAGDAAEESMAPRRCRRGRARIGRSCGNAVA